LKREKNERRSDWLNGKTKKGRAQKANRRCVCLVVREGEKPPQSMATKGKGGVPAFRSEKKPESPSVFPKGKEKREIIARVTLSVIEWGKKAGLSLPPEKKKKQARLARARSEKEGGLRGRGTCDPR